MMRMVHVSNGMVDNVVDIDPHSEDERRFYESSGFIESPPYVEVGWSSDFTNPPIQEGMQYDFEVQDYVAHEDYRRRLHQRTTDDVLEAQRKIREGDTSIDWQAWLDALDAYNRAVSATKEQETYPESVVYPEYPTKPAA